MTPEERLAKLKRLKELRALKLQMSGESDIRSPEAQAISAPQSKSQIAEQMYSTPFQTAGYPFGASLDIPMKHGFVPIAKGAAQIREGLNAPDVGTGALEVLSGMAKAAFPIALPLPSLLLGGIGDVISAASPESGELYQKALSPISTLTNPKSRAGIAGAELGDILTLGAALKGTKPALRGVKNLPGKMFPEQLRERGLRSADKNLDRAIPAGAKELTRPQDRARMRPYLGQQQRISPVKLGDRDYSVMRQVAEEKGPAIRERIYTEQDQMIQRNANYPLRGGVEEIANSIESLRNIYTENIDVLKDKSILDEAAKYREMGSLTLSEARELQRSLNAGLQEFYKKSNESQAAAENLGKPIAEMERAAESIREQIVRTLNYVGENGNWYRNKSLDYGAAARIEAATERNIVRAETPLPPMFTERASSLYPSKPGITREVAEHTVGKFFTPDKLMNRALNKYAQYGGEPTPPPPPPPASRFGGTHGIAGIPRMLPGGYSMPYPEEATIRISPADVVQPLARPRKALPPPSQIQLPAQFPNEVGSTTITSSRLKPLIESFGGKKYTTIHAQKVGSALNLNEAIEAFDKWKRGEYPAIHANQFYKEVAEGFLEEKFRGIDKKGNTKAYSPKQIQIRLDWLKRGIPVDQFPLESRIK